MTKTDLSGKIALVTGASGELGRVICRTLAECGADVALQYNTGEERAASVADEIRALGRKAVIARADVTRPSEMAALKEIILMELGSPEIVVLCAVIQYQWTSVLEQSIEDYEGQFRSCVLQAVLLAKNFVPAMLQRGAGRFIAINTECAVQCAPNQSAYVAGKRGMDGVLRVLAREIGPGGVTVNQVAPGWMISDRDRASGTERQSEYDRHLPLRHRGDDQDIANTVAFLASDAARFITGAFVPVCGGNVMPGI